MHVQSFVLILGCSIGYASYTADPVVNLQSVKSVATRFPASDSSYRDAVVNGYVGHKY